MKINVNAILSNIKFLLQCIINIKILMSYFMFFVSYKSLKSRVYFTLTIFTVVCVCVWIFRLATFQLLNSHRELAVTILESAVQHFILKRKVIIILPSSRNIV